MTVSEVPVIGVASAALFLMANTLVTGAVLDVDGGAQVS